MPDTIERIEAISSQPFEKLIDCPEPRGFFHATSGGRTRSITVRYTGPQSSVWETYRISAPGIPVSWAGDIFLRLQQLRGYPKNWDSYGGRPLTTAAYLGAYDLLGRIMFDRFPKPSVVPTGRGGVQFEWHMKGSHVEVYISPEGNAEVSFEDDLGGEWEGPLGEMVHRLTAVLGNL
jgi:hypothetical protein